MKQQFAKTLLSLLCTVLFFAADAQTSLKEVNSFATDHFANYLHFSKDARTLILVVGSNANIYERGNQGFQFKQTLPGNSGQSIHPGISPDGAFVAFSSGDKTVVYKKSDSYQLLQTILHTERHAYQQAIYFTGNDRFFTVNKDGFIRFYELSGNEFVEMTKVGSPLNSRFESASVSADGRWIGTVDAAGNVRCWKVNGKFAEPGKELMKIGQYLGKIALSNDGLLAVADEKKLSLYSVAVDLSTAAPLQTLNDLDCSAIRFSPDGRRLMVSTRNSNLAIYQVSKAGMTPEVQTAVSNLFHAIEMSSDGLWLAASNQDKKLLKIFEAPAPQENIKPAAVSNPAIRSAVAKNTKTTTPAADKKTAAVTKVGSSKSAIPFLKKNGKYILVDSLSLQPLSETEYKEFGNVTEGLRRVQNPEGKYGYVNPAGQEVIAFLYEYAGDFKDGLALVRRNGKAGWIDQSGKEVVPVQYDELSDFSNGLARAKRNKLYGFVDAKGNEVVPMRYTGARDFKEGLALVDIPGKRMFIDKTGKEIITFSSGAGVKDFSGGLSSAFLNMGQNWLFDKSGKDLLGKKITFISLSPSGVAILNNKAQYNETVIDGVYGMVDHTGKEILPMTYQYIADMGEGIFLVIQDGKQWCVDKTGNKVFDFPYQRFRVFKEGMAAVMKNGRWGYINKAGKEVVPPLYDEIGGTFSDGLSIVQSNGRWGFIDAAGKVVIPFRYKKAYGSFSNGLARMKETDKWDDPWFYINKKGVEYREKDAQDIIDEKRNPATAGTQSAQPGELVFELRQDFRQSLNLVWTHYVKNSDNNPYSAHKKVADGLLLLQNQQEVGGSVLLPVLDRQGRSLTKPEGATRLYSAGFLYLNGRGKLGWSMVTEDEQKKNASYDCTIDEKGVASLVFKDADYKEMVVGKTQLKDFKRGHLYVLTTVFDKNNISFYVNKQLIAAEKFRGFALSYATIEMGGQVAAALTHTDILAYYGGDKNYPLSQIEHSADVANTNYSLVKSNGSLAKYVMLPEEPTAKVEGENYRFLFFPSLVKDKQVRIGRMDKLAAQLKNIPALNAIEPYEVKVAVDTAQALSAQAYLAGQTNRWAEGQIPFGTKRTAAELAKSKARLKLVSAPLTVNGKKAQAVYVMREVAEYGRGYDALLVVPTGQKNVFACFRISAVGVNTGKDAKGYLFSPDNFAIMNAQARAIFSSFVYQN